MNENALVKLFRPTEVNGYEFLSRINFLLSSFQKGRLNLGNEHEFHFEAQYNSYAHTSISVTFSRINLVRLKKFSQSL